jgi:hypothetical protein
MTQALSNCSRCSSANEAGDLRCPVCYLTVPHVVGEADALTRVRIFRCPSCAAAMEYLVRVQAPHCAFCGGVLNLEEYADPVEQTEKYLPFTVDRETAEQVYRRWLLRQGFFRPSNLASAARLESLRALWWVGWAVDANAVITWTVDSDAGARRASWAPHSGELQTVFDDIVIPATRGLSSAECAVLIPSYRLASATDQPGTLDAAAVHERFETSRSIARGRVVDAIQRMAEGRIKGRDAPGTRFRNFHAAIHLRGLLTRRLAFPAYSIAYRYRGRLYRTVISGQDPDCVIGQSPLSWAKVFLVVALVVAGLAVLAVDLILRSGF